MKKDIFDGKIKKEYFSYILVSVIFITLLCVVIGGLVIYGATAATSTNLLGACIALGAVGAVIVLLGPTYFFLSLFAIRNYPKYEKLRRTLLNSDIYFTDSTSREYYGRGMGWSAWRARKAFEVVTTFAETEKRMGKKSLAKYKLNLAFSLSASALAVVFIVLAAIFKPSGTLFIFLFVCVLLVCLGFIVYFLKQALTAAVMSPYEDVKWKFDLSSLLESIAVRKNNKKLKFWYKAEQLNEIEHLVHSANENCKLELQRRGNKLVCFKVIDAIDGHKVFMGMFL